MAAESRTAVAPRDRERAIALYGDACPHVGVGPRVFARDCVECIAHHMGRYAREEAGEFVKVERAAWTYAFARHLPAWKSYPSNALEVDAFMAELDVRLAELEAARHEAEIARMALAVSWDCVNEARTKLNEAVDAVARNREQR